MPDPVPYEDTPAIDDRGPLLNEHGAPLVWRQRPDWSPPLAHEERCGLLRKLEDEDSSALLLDPRSMYDVAIVGVIDSSEATDDRWPREPGHQILVYDTATCLEAIRLMLGAEDDEHGDTAAQEWFDFNTSGAWAGQGTPTFRPVDWDKAAPAEAVLR